MKQPHLLLGSILIASLSFLGAQTVWGATGAKVTKAHVSKAKKVVKPRVRRGGSINLSRVSPEGVSLSLATSLREPVPAPLAPAPAPVSAPVAYTTYNLPTGYGYTKSTENPYLPRPTAMAAPAPAAMAAPVPVAAIIPGMSGISSAGLGRFLSDIKQSIPILSDSGESLLPTIKKVYPTGEKPLVVVSFKCPTELIGVAPPTIKILHELVNFGMDGINKTNLLSFNMQQVCQ